MIATLQIGDIDFEDYMAYVVPSNPFSRGKRETEKVSVPGRNGDLVFDNKKYPNKDINYTVIIMDDFADNFDRLSNDLSALVGYQRILDSIHPDEYRYGYVAGDLNPVTMPYFNTGRCVVTMNCKPQRYLISGETTQVFMNDGTITNPTNYGSFPIIRVYGYGMLGVGSDFITVMQNQFSFVEIDCETMDATANGADANGYVDFVNNRQTVLESGANGITLDQNISKVEIIPRWWRL